MSRTIKFSRNSDAEFVATIKERVNNYFTEKNLSKFGNYKMVIKSIFMLTLYLTPYSLLFVFDFESIWPVLGLWFVMGVGMSGIGLSIMHDANHGSYSKNRTLNKLMSSVIYLVGANALNWRIQHNVLHHTYTNIDGLDEDIYQSGVLRFSPHQPKLKHHKYQHLYAWFFYSILTLTWAFDADFRQIYSFKKNGLTKGHKKNFTNVLIELIGFKLFYYVFIFAIPLIFTEIPWWHIVLGFLLMQMISGLILAAIFQPAHVVGETEFPLPDEKGNMEHSWLVHQLHTTANFAQYNKALTWFVGGLNHQVEHHLFPTICHVHYPAISGIVQQTAKDFNIPYHSFPTFRAALVSHVKMLKKLGNED